MRGGTAAGGGTGDEERRDQLEEGALFWAPTTQGCRESHCPAERQKHG